MSNSTSLLSFVEHIWMDYYGIYDTYRTKNCGFTISYPINFTAASIQYEFSTIIKKFFIVPVWSSWKLLFLLETNTMVGCFCFSFSAHNFKQSSEEKATPMNYKLYILSLLYVLNLEWLLKYIVKHCLFFSVIITVCIYISFFTEKIK